jgi:hypothetical protein
MYTALFDGLRSYYARYPSRRAAAGFDAAMSLSFICCVNVGSLLVVGDFLLTGSSDRAFELSGNKILLLALGIAIAVLHVVFAKRTGRYNSVAPVDSPRWKRYLWVYGAVSAGLFVAAMAVAVIGSRGDHQ